MASLRDRVVAAYKAFREPYLVSEPATADDDFSAHDARKLRYAIFWSFYENSAYRNVHSWSTQYRVDFGLYRYIRNIYNPAYRLGEFWKSHLWGGLLDPEAGDGEDVPSSLPIEIAEDVAGGQGTGDRPSPLRVAIATLWGWSNWQVKKDVVTLWGAVLGDVGLRVMDDAQRQKVYLEVVHPSIVKEIVLDPFGNAKGYTFEEGRPDPEKANRTVTYTEVCSREGGNVVFRTLRNGRPYAWNGQAAEWTEPYGFVPLVMIRHNDVGLDWGWSELQPIRSKIHEVDDLASKLSDQVRKMVDSPWLMTGVSRPRSTVTASSQDSEAYRSTSTAADVPYPGREEMPMFYAPEGAGATALVAPLDIAATAEYIKSICAEIERDFPELQMDIWNAGAYASGKALRIARQRVEIKVAERRPSYDDALVRAQQMAIAIGGFRGYEGFGGFGLESYGRGDLDHSIGKRSVFASDPLDDVEMDDAFWTAAGKATKAGVPLELYLEWQGWDEARIEQLVGSEERQSRQALMRMAQNLGDRQRQGEEASAAEAGREEEAPAGEQEQVG